VKLTIIEAANQLLPALPGKLANATQQQLVKLGIDLKLGRRVIEVTKEAFIPMTAKWCLRTLKSGRRALKRRIGCKTWTAWKSIGSISWWSMKP